MTIGLAIHRGRWDIPELPGGMLRESCRTPVVDRFRTLPSARAMSAPPGPPTRVPPRPIVARVREAIAARHYSRRTEKAYARWIERYLSFHNGRSAEEMGEGEVTQRSPRFSFSIATSCVASSTGWTRSGRSHRCACPWCCPEKRFHASCGISTARRG
jgi:hypothetical protein